MSYGNISRIGTPVALKEENLNQRNPMTLIIFISAFLLSYGAFELKEAMQHKGLS